MQANQYDVYAQFLLGCKKIMGTLDLEKLVYDEEYRTEFFNRVSLNSDNELFQMADLINRELDTEH